MANVQRLQNALAIVLILLTILMIIAHWYWLIPILLVANFISMAATRALMREARNRAEKIWSLAKQLELSADDLHRLTQAYTVQDWQASQPSHLVFVPDPVLAWHLIDTLEKQRTTLTQDLSSVTKR